MGVSALYDNIINNKIYQKGSVTGKLCLYKVSSIITQLMLQVEIIQLYS